MADKPMEILDVYIPCQTCGKLIPAGGNSHCLTCRVWRLRLKEIMPRWIPVTERLPTHREWVLVWHTGYKTPKKAFYKDDLAPYLPIFRLDGDNGIHGEVTHWMPLPEPPNT